MLNWKIFYEDRSTFSNLDGPAYSAPKRGVIAVVERAHSIGYVVHKRGDFYLFNPAWDEPRWRMMDISGFWDYMFEPGLKCILFGRYASNDRYNEVMIVAEEFGQKHTWTLNEIS